MSKQPLYLYVTKDRYRLPLFVAESKCELARMLGLSESNVCHALHDAQRGMRKNSHYEVVWVDEEEDS